MFFIISLLLSLLRENHALVCHLVAVGDKGVDVHSRVEFAAVDGDAHVAAVVDGNGLKQTALHVEDVKHSLCHIAAQRHRDGG